jgi:glycosyltransferase involved in cell wall biosynthesis
VTTPLNILLVSDVYPPVIGGAELQTQLLAKKLRERGNTVNVATTWQPGLNDRDDENGVTVHRVKGLSSMVPWFSTNPNRRLHPPMPDPASVVGLRKVIKAVRPQVIHAYGWMIYSAAVALTGTRIPLVIAMREYANSCALRTMLYQRSRTCDGPALAKCYSCAIDFFGAPKGIAATTGVKLGRGLLRNRVRGIHNISEYMRFIAWRDIFSVDNPKGEVRMRRGNNIVADAIIPSFRDDAGERAKSDVTRISKYLDMLPEKPFILFVGALRKVKGLDALLGAYAKLKPETRPPLVLFGVPSTDTPKVWPDGVQIFSNVPHDAVMASWERALFGVFPSLWAEPFGNVVHEAMSKGRPAIGTTPGGHTDMIVHGKTGYITQPGDSDDLAQAMQSLIDSPALREQMGVAARERARLFSAEIVVPKFEQFFADVIEKSR